MDRAIIEVEQDEFTGCRVGLGLYLIPVLCGLSLMFAFSPLLTKNAFLDIYYVYETGFLCLGIVCMIILTCVLKKTDSRRRPSFSKYYSACIVITGVGAIVLPCLDIYMIHFLKSCSTAIFRVQGFAIANKFVVAGFTICLGLFVLYLRNHKTTGSCSSCLLTVVVATAISLCACAAKNTFWATNILSIDSHNKTYISSAQAIFKYCENVSSWSSNVKLYGTVYHVGYKFQTEFALLSLVIMISALRLCFSSQADEGETHADEELGLVNSCAETSYEIPDGTDYPPHQYGTIIAKLQYDIRCCFSNYCACVAVIVCVLTFTGFYLCDKLRLINWGDTEDETVGYSVAQFVYNCVISGVTLVAYVSTTQFVTERRRLNASDFVFLLSSGGHLTMLMFEMTLVSEGKTSLKAWLFLLKTVLHFISLFAQIMLVLKLSRIHDIRVRRSDAWWPYVAFRVFLVFVGAINIEKWIGDTVFTPPFIKHINASHSDLNLQLKWRLIIQVVYPYVTMSRLLTAIACFEAFARFQKNSRNKCKKCLVFMFQSW